MIYYGARELSAAFLLARNRTIRIAEEVPEAKYDFRASPDTRSLGQILAHIAVSPGYQLEIHTRRVTDLSTVSFAELRQRFSLEEGRLRTREEIVTSLNLAGKDFATFLEELTETFLAEPVRMRPGAAPAVKSRFEMLLFVKEHEIHHQGQLMLLERMIGMVPHTTRELEQRIASPPPPRPS